MNRPSLRLAAPAALLALAALAPPAPAQTPGDAGARDASLDAGAPDAGATDAAAPADARPPEVVASTSEEVPGLSVRRGRADTVIDAPFDVVARAVLDYPHYNTFMPHISEARVVRRNRADTDVYMQVPLRGQLGVMWSLVRVNARRTPDRLELVGHAVDGNMERFESTTVIERVPGPTARTRLMFTLLALPRLPFPSSVFTREMVDASRTVAGNLRAQIHRSLVDAGAPR